MITKQTIFHYSTDVLSKYFTLNGKDAQIDLYFDTFEELIDKNFGNGNTEMLNSTLFDKLNAVFALIPRKYEITVNLHIKDFGSYEPEKTKQIIKDNFALKIHALALEQRRKNITGLSLLFGGCAMLLASYLLSRLAWPQIIFDIINISGTLFVWEAADIGIIARAAERKHAIQYMKKFKNIHVRNDSDQTQQTK